MKLALYLKLTDQKPQSFAGKIGVDPVSVYRYCTGERRPHWSVMQRIREQTEGNVTADDFLDSPKHPWRAVKSGLCPA